MQLPLDAQTIEADAADPKVGLHIANGAAALWTGFVAVFTVILSYSIYRTRQLIVAVAEAGGGAEELSNAVWYGEFDGESYFLGPDGFELAFGGLVTYSTGLVLLVVHWALRTSPKRAQSESEVRLSKAVTRTMVGVVVFQILLMQVFGADLAVAQMHTDG